MKFGKLIKYNIEIIATDNEGFYVKVGCGRFSFSSKDDLLKGLSDYLDDPEASEKLYNEIPGNIPTNEVMVDEVQSEGRESGTTRRSY